MIAIDTIKFTFKNFWKLLPYYITPFLLVTIGGGLGFMPIYFQTPAVIILALIGLIVLLASFWSYIVKGAGVHSVVNGMLAMGQIIPFEGADKNITQRTGKFIKFLLVLGGLSILVALPVALSGFIFVKAENIALALVLFFISLGLIVWFSLKISMAYPAFIFNDFEKPMDAIKYSFEITKGKEGEIFAQTFVMTLLMKIILFALAIIPAIIFAFILGDLKPELAKDAYDIIDGLLGSLIYFTAMPILVTMLYRKFAGTFTHPDWVALEASKES